MSPQRIQRKRTKGWRMPKGAIYVGRPTKWGNPYRRVEDDRVIDEYGRVYFIAPGENWRGVAVRHYHEDLMDGRLCIAPDELAELAGHDLACWCPIDQPCHADVLLSIANGGAA